MFIFDFTSQNINVKLSYGNLPGKLMLHNYPCINHDFQRKIKMHKYIDAIPLTFDQLRFEYINLSDDVVHYMIYVWD